MRDKYNPENFLFIGGIMTVIGIAGYIYFSGELQQCESIIGSATQIFDSETERWCRIVSIAYYTSIGSAVGGALSFITGIFKLISEE